eukprot:9478421-Pyramimonas_sp.AAC.1
MVIVRLHHPAHSCELELTSARLNMRTHVGVNMACTNAAGNWSGVPFQGNGYSGLSEYYSDYTLSDGTVVCAKDKEVSHAASRRGCRAFRSSPRALIRDVTLLSCSFFGTTSLLSEGVGYAIVLGFGVFFSLFTSFM